MPTARESDPENMNPAVSNNDTSSSSRPATAATLPPNPKSTEHGDFPLAYDTAATERRCYDNSNKSSDDPSPQNPYFPSTVHTSHLHSQISDIPGDQEDSASYDAGAQPLYPLSTFHEKDRETMARERNSDDGSPDRFFVIDEATRLEGHEGESDNGARVEGRAGKRERSSEVEVAPMMQREGRKEGDRERRLRELREGVLEEEGRL